MRDRFPRITRSIISAPTNFQWYNVVFTFPSSTWLWKSSPIPIIFSGIHCIEASFWCANVFQPGSNFWVWCCCSQDIDCFPLSQVDVGNFVKSALVRRAGCGALLFATDCIRQWRRFSLLCATAALASALFPNPFKNTWRIAWKANFWPHVFCWWPCQLALGRHGGVGWELRKLY